MKKYTLNPTLGFRQAYMVLNPQATNDDFLTWLREQDDSEKDPRLMNSAMAVLCDQALSELVERQACVVGSKLVADVAGALSHYETSIRAFTALIGHCRFERLSMLEPVEALKTCLPNHVHAEDIF